MSKGLDVLKRITYHLNITTNEKDKYALSKEFGDDYKIIEKELKALEIIKDKCYFFSLEDCGNETYRVYDNELYRFNELTKEEYELLKEVLL